MTDPKRSLAGKIPSVKLTAVLIVSLIVLVAVYTWPAVIETRSNFGNSLLMAGIAMAILGFLGMGVSTSRYGGLRALLREGRSYERLKKRSERNVSPYMSVILSGAISGGIGYLLVILPV